MRNRFIGFILCISVCMASACGTTSSSTETVTSTEEAGTQTAENGTGSSTGASTTEGINVNLTGDYSDTALNASYDEATATKIELSSEDVNITEGGTYILSGTLADGQVIVNAPEDENVQIVLAGANITCSDSAAISVVTAKNVFLTLADGTENTIADTRAASTTETAETTDTSDIATETTEEDLSAAIYSKTDLIINGTGALTVTGNYNDGITSKDDLEIISGTIHVTATDDGIVGKDSVCVCDGTIEITAGGDGIKSTNTEDTEKGYVVIDGGTFTISAGDDGIHSETVLVINDGTIEVAKSEEGLESLNIIINDGTIHVTAADDGVNISGGTTTTATTGEAPTGEAPTGEATADLPEGEAPTGEAPADLPEGEAPTGEAPADLPEGEAPTGEAPADLAEGEAPTGERPERGAEKGELSTEEMEARANGTGRGNGGKMSGGGMFGGGGSFESIDGCLVINGGTLVVNAAGDGIDSNGDILITGGTTTVYGPENGGNAAVDYNDVLEIDGGVLYAIGCSAMAQNESEASSQTAVTGTFNTTFTAGTVITLTDAAGNVLAEVTSEKTGNYVMLSIPELAEGESYQITAGDQTLEVTAGK